MDSIHFKIHQWHLSEEFKNKYKVHAMQILYICEGLSHKVSAEITLVPTVQSLKESQGEKDWAVTHIKKVT